MAHAAHHARGYGRLGRRSTDGYSELADDRGVLVSNGAAGRSERLHFITAISVFGSVLTTLASSIVPSAKATFTSVAPSTTWLAVTI